MNNDNPKLENPFDHTTKVPFIPLDFISKGTQADYASERAAKLRANDPEQALALAQQLMGDVFPARTDPKDIRERFTYELTWHIIKILCGVYHHENIPFNFDMQAPSNQGIALLKKKGWHVDKDGNMVRIFARPFEVFEVGPAPYADPRYKLPSPDMVKGLLHQSINIRNTGSQSSYAKTLRNFCFHLIDNRLPDEPSVQHLFIYHITKSCMDTLLDANKGNLDTVFTVTLPYDEAFSKALRDKDWFVEVIPSPVPPAEPNQKVPASMMVVSTETHTPHGDYHD